MLFTIDIGTSSFKSALWDLEGKNPSFAAVPLTNSNDCTQWLRAFETCCIKLAAASCAGNLGAVQVIIISGNGPSLVPVTGKPNIGNKGLSVAAENARLWLDRSAVKYQTEVSDVMGGFVDSGFFLPKILGIKNDEKELYDKTNCFLGCPEYLAYALTGEARTVFPSDGFDRWFWNNSILEKLNLDTKKFPPFIRPGEMFGTIIPSVAEHFGFAKNIPVITGGPDFFAAILGAGITQPGQACDRTGSSEGINLCTLNRINDNRLMSYGHPVKPYWNLSGVISTTGRAIQWCRELLGIASFEEFFSLAQSSEAGCKGIVFVPYLAGERAPVWDPSLRALWHGLSLDSGRAQLVRSVLEGIGFAIKNVIDVMEESTGGGFVSELRVTGGLADNVCLNQIKADITGKVILESACKEAELLGLAVIGSCYLQRFSSWAEASASMVCIKKRYEPNRENTGIYNQLFKNYLTASNQSK